MPVDAWRLLSNRTRWRGAAAALAATLLWALVPGLAVGQEVRLTLPTVNVDPFPYGPGFYFSLTKLALTWVTFLLWVRTADWINQDAQTFKFKTFRWNSLTLGSFAAGAVLLIIIPIFWLGWPLLVLTWLVPMFVYVGYRNPRVEPQQTVLNADHLRFWFSERLAPLGIKIDAERKSADQLGPPVKFTARGGETNVHDNANLMAAKESPAYEVARALVADALARRAGTIMLDYTAQAVAVRYEVDGLWSNGEAQDRETGDAVLTVYKTISALNPRERRARQRGSFGAEFDNTKYTCRIVSQGTKTGERVVMQFDDGKTHFKKLPELGMRDKQIEQLVELLDQPSFIVFSSPPGGGLSALVGAALGTCDRYVRSYISIDEVNAPERAIENVTVTTYDAAAGEKPLDVLPRLLRAYPDVIVVRDLVNAETLNLLLDQPAERRTVLTTVRARDSVEALARLLMMQPDVAKFAETVSASVNVRLVRKLCETCREAYAPQPALLQKLGLPPGKVEALYRPPQQPEEVCATCGGVGYIGRTGMYEVLVVGPQLRAQMAAGAKLDAMRLAARKEGLRTIQEEGILLVARGVTSLQELQRVLKE
ncbi:MAG: Flp pilus assembly complex ATPase component TadA [Pirellulales bacterium]|nr:Flp pilus assembly complex ATPase component TadA [Pirellulales bacterium]